MDSKASPSPSSGKNRRHERVVFTRTVKVRTADNIIGEFNIRNLSIGGVFMIGADVLDTGDECLIELHETGHHSSLILNFSGIVVRKDGQGIAVEFTDMGDDSFMFLQTMLLYASDDPTGIAEKFYESFDEVSSVNSA